MEPETQRNLSRLQTIAQLGIDFIKEAQPLVAYSKKVFCKDEPSEHETFQAMRVESRIDRYEQVARYLYNAAACLNNDLIITDTKIPEELSSQINLLLAESNSLAEEKNRLSKIVIERLRQ